MGHAMSCDRTMATRGSVGHLHRAVTGSVVHHMGPFGDLRLRAGGEFVVVACYRGNVVPEVPGILPLLHGLAVVVDALGGAWRPPRLSRRAALLLVVHKGLLVGPRQRANHLLLPAISPAGRRGGV